MSDAQFIHLINQARRKFAVSLVLSAPEGYMVKISPATRSSDQNAMLWALLTDVSKQIPWEVNGKIEYLEPEDWKDIFTASLKTELRNAKGLNGQRVLIGLRSSKLNKQEFGDLINLILAFGDNRGVIWSDNNVETA